MHSPLRNPSKFSSARRLLLVTIVLAVSSLSSSPVQAATTKYFDAWANEGWVYNNGSTNRYLVGAQMTHYDASYPYVRVFNRYVPTLDTRMATAQAYTVILSHSSFYSRSFCTLFNSLGGDGVVARCWYST